MTEDADKRFNGLNLRAGIKVRKLLIELGIRTEDAECNLRGVIVIFNLFVIVIVVCKVVIPSREKSTDIVKCKSRNGASVSDEFALFN